MIDTIEALKTIGEHRTNEVVVPTMSVFLFWPAISKRPELDLHHTGCMGKASSLALGVALSQPRRRVIALDADGSLLMNLGSLVTIANQAPANFLHFVFENGVYQNTGGQPIPGAGKFDFSRLARAAGYRNAYEFDDLESLNISLGRIFKEDGPTFVCLKVSRIELPEWPEWGTSEAWPRVKEALAKYVSG
ncbi:MAG: thiamine pyrophosphate-binding protein [Chloroflexi bacterium]|nr:thiamine pyrophosphate-binding protein [Chloroflexota bacterium]